MTKCPPFLLSGVINQHPDTWESQYPKLIKEIRDGLYVDDLMTGGRERGNYRRKESYHHKSSMPRSLFTNGTQMYQT